MILVKYLIFLIFNHYYKDGHYKKDDMPYFTAILFVMFYEGFTLLIAISFLDRYWGTTIFANIFDPLEHIVYGCGALMFVFIYPLNYYFFIKKNGFNHIYGELRDAKINTKRNRIFGWIFLILFLVGAVVLAGHLKYLFP